MKKPIWNFSTNQFLNATKKNFCKAMKLSRAHDSYLLQKKTDFPLDPDWILLYDRYHIEHLAFQVAYTNWKSSGGNLSGDTKTVTDLLKKLPVLLDLWMSTIMLVYNKASAKFKALFPQGRSPFEKGAIDVRIDAIKKLSNTIGTDASIADAKTLIDATLAEIDTARGAQEGEKSSKKSLSKAVETARVNAMGMQLADTGFLLNKYYKTPRAIEDVFDLHTLRNRLKSFFILKMKTTETSEITKNTFVATDELRGRVDKASNLTDKVTLYLASTPGGIDSPGIPFMNNTSRKVEVSEFLVDLDTHVYLTAVTDGNSEIVNLAVELY